MQRDKRRRNTQRDKKQQPDKLGTFLEAAPNILSITGTEIYWKIQGAKASAATGTNAQIAQMDNCTK
jgi:hypothetical protein